MEEITVEEITKAEQENDITLENILNILEFLEDPSFQDVFVNFTDYMKKLINESNTSIQNTNSIDGENTALMSFFKNISATISELKNTIPDNFNKDQYIENIKQILLTKQNAIDQQFQNNTSTENTILGGKKISSKKRYSKHFYKKK